jgi:Ca2+-binding EF-hand superfamily protein
MKRLLLMATLATSVWATDYSTMSTEQLANMRGSVPVEERGAFQQEMQKRMQGMSAEERQKMMGGGQGKGGMMGRNMPTFESFDLNGDGKVDAKEFDEAQSKRMAEQAASGKMMKNAGNAPTFTQIDTDKDGLMSQEEFQSHQQQHMKQMQGQNRP